MNENIAAGKADLVLTKILENHPEIFAKTTFNSVESAEEAAEAVAAFRRRLIVKLSEQGQ